MVKWTDMYTTNGRETANKQTYEVPKSRHASASRDKWSKAQPDFFRGHHRLSWISRGLPRKTFWDAGWRFSYRSDAFPDTQPTPSKLGQSAGGKKKQSKLQNKVKQNKTSSIRYYHYNYVSQKCPLGFLNLKQLEPIIVMFGLNILKIIASKSVHNSSTR